MINKLKIKIRNFFWRKYNKHNSTYLETIFPFEKVIVGKGTYGPLFIKTWSSDKEKLSIGNYCSISEGVKFILGGNHLHNTLTTYPYKVKTFKIQKEEAVSKGPIIVEDDVWIGSDAIILSGVRIGQGAIIGAATVVTKDVPPYAIVVGNPGIIIKKRFSDQIIDYLVKELDLSKIDLSKISINELYSPITSIYDIQRILNKIS